MDVHQHLHTSSPPAGRAGRHYFWEFLLLFFAMFIQIDVNAQKPRARDIGIPFDGTTGKFNAITDVKGVEVGYSTIISGEGKNVRGKVLYVPALLLFFQEAETTILFMLTGIR